MATGPKTVGSHEADNHRRKVGAAGSYIPSGCVRRKRVEMSDEPNNEESKIEAGDTSNGREDVASNAYDLKSGSEPAVVSSPSGQMKTAEVPLERSKPARDPVQVRSGELLESGKTPVTPAKAAHGDIDKIFKGFRSRSQSVRTDDASETLGISSKLHLKPFEVRGGGVFDDFQPEDADTVLSEFHRERLLVVTCANPTVLGDIADLIARDARFAPCEKFHVEQCDLNEATKLPDLLKWHRNHTSEKGTLSFMHLGNKSLFDSMRADLSKTYYNRAPRELETSKGWMVLIVAPAAAVMARNSMGEIPVWQLPWLQAMLVDRYRRRRDRQTDLSEPSVVLARFEEQCDLWPQDEEHLSNDVMSILADRQDGYRRFVEEIARRPQQTREVRSIPALEDLPELHLEILFLATFFPETPTPAFDQMLETLVAGVVHWSDAEASAPAPTTAAPSFEAFGITASFDASPMSDASLESQPTVSENLQAETNKAVKRLKQAAIEVWRTPSERRNVLRKIPVVARQDAEGERVIDLSDQSLRSQLEDAFRNGEYLKKRFERLRDARLLFEAESALPERVARHLIRMNCIVAEEYRSVLSDHWLRDLLVYYEVENTVLAIWKQVLEQIGKRRHFFFDRFGSLCAELLRNERTARFVVNLLRELVDSRNLSCTSEFVLELLDRLRSVDSFDETEWYKQILNKGDSELRLRVVDEFLDRSVKSQGMLWSVLEKMVSWHPPVSRESLSMHEQYALGFLLCFHSFWLHRHDIEKSEEQLPHPVLGGGPVTAENDGKQPSSAERIVSWLLHPKCCQSTKRIIADQRELAIADVELEPAELIAHILHAWANFAAEVKNDAARAFVDEMVDVLRSRADKRLRGEVILVLQSYAEVLATERERTTDRKKSIRLKEEVGRVKTLRNRLRGVASPLLGMQNAAPVLGIQHNG